MYLKVLSEYKNLEKEKEIRGHMGMYKAFKFEWSNLDSLNGVVGEKTYVHCEFQTGGIIDVPAEVGAFLAWVGNIMV